jgi:steroid delta-isomerase
VPNLARQAVERYVELVNGADLDGLVALFTDDAVLTPPRGVDERHGVAEIRSFYADLVLPQAPAVTPTNIIEAGTQCVAELTAVMGGEPSHLIDVFEVGDAGKVTRLAIYMR